MFFMQSLINLLNVLWPTVAWAVAIMFSFPFFGWFSQFQNRCMRLSRVLFSYTDVEISDMTENYDYWRFAINSVITASFATLFALVVGVPAAYAMAFNPTKRTKDVLVWMLSTKMLPAAAVLYPMTFLTKNYLAIYDTHFLIILVLCLINLPIVIWMLFTYFKEIPREIIEASKMDGVTTWGEIKHLIAFGVGWIGLYSLALFYLLLE